MKAHHIDFYKLNFHEIPGDILIGAHVGFSDETANFAASFVFLRKLGKSALGSTGKNDAVLVPLKSEGGGKPVFLAMRDFARSGITAYAPTSDSPDFFIFENAKKNGKPAVMNGFGLLPSFKATGGFEDWIEFPVFAGPEGRGVFSMDGERVEFLENVSLPENFLSVFYAKNARGARIFAVKRGDRRYVLHLADEKGGKMEKKTDGADAFFRRGGHLFLLTRADIGTTAEVYDLETGKRAIEAFFPEITNVYDAMYDKVRETLYLFATDDSSASSPSRFCTVFHAPSGKRKRFRTGSGFLQENPGEPAYLFVQGENGEVFIWYGSGNERGDVWIHGRKFFGNDGEITEIPLEGGSVRVVGIGNGGVPYRPVYGVDDNYEIAIFDERGNVEKTGTPLKGGVLYDETPPDGDSALILSVGRGKIKPVRGRKAVDIEGEFEEGEVHPIEIPDSEGKDVYGAVMKKGGSDLLLIFPEREEGGGIAYVEIPPLSVDFSGVRASFATEKIDEKRRIVTIVIDEAEFNGIVTLLYDAETAEMRLTDRFEERNDMGNSIRPLTARLIKTERRRRSLGIFGSERRNVSYIHVSEDGKIHARDFFIVDGKRNNIDVFLFERDGNRYYAVNTEVKKSGEGYRICVEIEERPSEKRFTVEIPIGEENQILFETVEKNPETVWTLITQDGNNLDLMKESIKYVIETAPSTDKRAPENKEIGWESS